MLTWAGKALASAALVYSAQHGHLPASSATAIVRQAVVVFEKRNNPLPSPGARRNVTHLIGHLHLYLSVRTTEMRQPPQAARI